jgi:hypothetical protein
MKLATPPPSIEAGVDSWLEAPTGKIIRVAFRILP